MASTSTSSARTRRLAVAVALCALISGLIALTAGAQPGHAQDHAPLAKPGKGGKGGKTNYKQPNIVVIVTDDQAKSTVIPEAMPNLFTRLMPRGTTFSDYVVTTPLCCPSRAAYMTGQYGHNNGILRNVYGDLIQKRNVLPAWLKYAGYNTAHVGKFLNGYEQGKLGPAAVAPGFDLWFTELEKRRYYNWKASKNGKIRHYGTDDNDHVTKVTSDFAVRWTKRLARKKDPFYMQVDYYAPHTSTGRDTRCASSPVPEPVDEHRFDAYPLPTPRTSTSSTSPTSRTTSRAAGCSHPTTRSRSSAATAARWSPSTASTAGSGGSWTCSSSGGSSTTPSSSSPPTTATSTGSTGSPRASPIPTRRTSTCR